MTPRTIHEPRPAGGRWLLLGVALAALATVLILTGPKPAGACEPADLFPPEEWPQCTTTTAPEETTTTTTAPEETTSTTAPTSSTNPPPTVPPSDPPELPRTGPADWVLVLAVAGACLLGMGLLRMRTDGKAAS